MSTWGFGSGLLNAFQSHTAGASGHELQKYLSHVIQPWLRDCRGSWMRSNLHFSSLLTTLFDAGDSVAEWLFSMTYCSLPSVRKWKYAAYRGTSHVPAVDDDAGKEDRAIRCGLTLDGDWWKAKGPDLQASTITANRRLRYNNLSRNGPEKDLGKWKITHRPDRNEKYTAHLSDLDLLQHS